MEDSTGTVIEKVQIESIDSEESKEDCIKSMDVFSEVVEITEKSSDHCESTNPLKPMDISPDVSEVTEKSTEHSEPTNIEVSNQINDLSNQSKVPVETLSEQLADEDKTNKIQIENNHSKSIDNEVTTADQRNTVLNEKPTRKPDLFFIDNHSSLDAIAAEYDSSDSENEGQNDSSTKVSNSNVYRNKDKVVDTDSDSSDSESDSSSSESESDSDNVDCKNSSDDSEEEKPKNTKGNKSTKTFKPKSEFDDLPPIEDLKISVPEVLCDPLGEVAWTVEQMVVVRPKSGKPTLNLDTVLFIEKGQRALGHIFDVFGQVTEPHYCVRFNSSDHIRESDIKVGMTVYYCPNTEYTSLVFLSELTKMKAIDDIGDDEAPQFSDDEEEQAYLASLQNKQHNKKVQESCSENPKKRKRANKTGWQSNHPWNSNKDQQQNVQPHSSKPFYRPHHPWSRPRHQQQNQWRSYNLYPNQWMGPPPQMYNQMHAYNQYFTPAHARPTDMQNQFPQGQWNPLYQLPQINALPLQGMPPTFVPPLNLPPPPPPPPPPSTGT